MSNSTTILTPIIDAVLKRGVPNTTTLPAATIVDTVENVSLKVTIEKSPANNRRSRIKQYVATLQDVGLEINFPADSSDAHLAAFKTAAINGYPIPIQCTDGGPLVFNGLMGVESLDNDQQLTGISGYKFSLFPWAVGSAATRPALS